MVGPHFFQASAQMSHKRPPWIPNLRIMYLFIPSLLHFSSQYLSPTQTMYFTVNFLSLEMWSAMTTEILLLYFQSSEQGLAHCRCSMYRCSGWTQGDGDYSFGKAAGTHLLFLLRSWALSVSYILWPLDCLKHKSVSPTLLCQITNCSPLPLE